MKGQRLSVQILVVVAILPSVFFVSPLVRPSVSQSVRLLDTRNRFPLKFLQDNSARCKLSCSLALSCLSLSLCLSVLSSVIVCLFCRGRVCRWSLPIGSWSGKSSQVISTIHWTIPSPSAIPFDYPIPNFLELGSPSDEEVALKDLLKDTQTLPATIQKRSEEDLGI